jgi:hypothetical protein
MNSKKFRILIALTLLLITALIGGCSSSGAHRVAGLSTDGVVRTFIDLAKNNNMNEASLYVAPSSTTDSTAVLNFMTGQDGLSAIKNANILSLKQVAQQGDYAVVVATLQQEPNTIKLLIKPVALEKIDSEWYIVDINKVYTDAKYKVLAQLLSNI